MRLIDTHCHLDFPAFDHDRTDVLTRTRKTGVIAVVIPGVTAASWPRMLQHCDNTQAGPFPARLPGLGLHPVFHHEHQPADIARLRERLQQKQAVAVGEIGLDHTLDPRYLDTQRWYFDQQLALAREFGLPVLLHVRKAHDSAIQSLRKATVPGGVVHAFNGSLQQAHAYIALNFKLGFGGMLTYQRSTKLRRLARELPGECLVLETDAPDMTVASHQYQRNSPEYLPEILCALSTTRGTDPETLAQVTTANALAVLDPARTMRWSPFPEQALSPQAKRAER